jgi:hypothetical protein
VTRLILIFISVLAAGCWARPEIELSSFGSSNWGEAEAATEETAFELLTELERALFDEAWKDLRRFSYTRKQSISARDQDGLVAGKASQTIDFSGNPEERNVRISAADSSGSFERSLWALFYDPEISAAAQEVAQEGWPALVLPEDPLFLSKQGRSFFRYAVVGDTVIAGTTVTMLEIAVRPDAAREGIQWARLFLADSSVVGVEARVAQRSLLYHEISTYRLMLSPAATGQWHPYEVMLKSSVGLPFARTRFYEMHVAYLDIRTQ